jgi:hypothetical protein
MRSLLKSLRDSLGTNAQHEERRAFPRVDASIRADIVSVNGDPLAQSVPGVIENISGGGLRLRSAQRFEPRSTIHVVFTFPGDTQPTETDVDVLACEQSADWFVTRGRFVALRSTPLWNIVSWTRERLRSR